MKKLFFLLAVALPCLIFTACGDDDDDDLTSANGTTSDNKPQGGSQGSGQGVGENTGEEPAEEGVVNGHEWVDLGLSVKWATCNVGASKPEEYGDYFAWGETKPKSVYNWSTYKWCHGSKDSMTKYCIDSSDGYNGFRDSKTILDPADDAATANWGSGWRMPTHSEQFRLRTDCTWTWTTQNGVYGHKVTGPNGRSIFLPAAGCRDGSVLDGAGLDGTGRYDDYYWSSSLYTGGIYSGSSNYAYYLWYYPVSANWYESYRYRYYGHSVRPVCQ